MFFSQIKTHDTHLALVLAAASAEGSSDGETSLSSAAELLEDLEGVRSRYCCCSILS